MVKIVLPWESITQCFFGFYNEDEIRKLSCCEITEPKALSVLNTPQPNGLYDPRLGAISIGNIEPLIYCQFFFFIFFFKLINHYINIFKFFFYYYYYF